MTTMTRMQRREMRLKKQKKEAKTWLLKLLVVFMVLFCLRVFVVNINMVSGPSMQETLHSGQVVVVDKLTPAIDGYDYGDIIICRYPGDRGRYIKRIIGFPGDTIEIRNGITYRNGEEITEDYVLYPTQEDYPCYTVPAETFFVMGDNRSNSHDSRMEGGIPVSLMLGRVFCVCWPFSEFQFI